MLRNEEMSYTCYLISNKPQYIEPISKSFYPEKFEYFNGEGFSSFSKLVNSCVAHCPTETVVIMSDKVLPTKENLDKTLKLIEEGYGLVGLYRLAFFGFKKELFRRIGMMDERFLGGWFEDDDIYTRLQEANISAYLTHEVAYDKRGKSSWHHPKEGRQHLINKWGSIPRASGTAKRSIPEEIYNYELGPSVPQDFKPWSESIVDMRTGNTIFNNLKNIKII